MFHYLRMIFYPKFETLNGPFPIKFFVENEHKKNLSFLEVGWLVIALPTRLWIIWITREVYEVEFWVVPALVSISNCLPFHQFYNSTLMIDLSHMDYKNGTYIPRWVTLPDFTPTESANSKSMQHYAGKDTKNRFLHFPLMSNSLSYSPGL